MGSVLVTGGTGQLATAIRAGAGPRRVEVVGRPTFDFERPDSIALALDRVSPALVVNAAAWTAVDAAEQNRAAADRANRCGPARLATICAGRDIPLIQISTDYVFDGTKGAPYIEADCPNPLGVYGASKRAGELAVLAGCRRCIVVRTSWVYAARGRNFLTTMLSAARRTPRLRVVADQIGSPTAAHNLAECILTIADAIALDWRDEFRGIFHAAGSGWTSWHGFAEEIFAGAARYGYPSPLIDPIGTTDWPTTAPRPADSRLDCGKLDRVFGFRFPDWRVGLHETLAQIFASPERRVGCDLAT